MMVSDPSAQNKENGKSYLDMAQARFNTDKFTKEASGHSSLYKSSNMNGRFEYSHDQLSSSRHNGRYTSPSHPTDVTSTASKSTKKKKRKKAATEDVRFLNKTDLILL